jgi:hypothetical protein
MFGTQSFVAAWFPNAMRAVESLDDLICPDQHRWRDGEAEYLGGLQVDENVSSGSYRIAPNPSSPARIK